MKISIVLTLVWGSFFLPLAAWGGPLPPPTHADLRYSAEFERSELDLWLPETTGPSPVLLYFHGGAFRGGDKRRVPYQGGVVKLIDRGVAVASAGYPFLNDAGLNEKISPIGYVQIMAHTELALAFLQKNSERFGLDMSRLAVSGTSAGALIAEYLTYGGENGVAVCIAIQQPYEVERVKNLIGPEDPPLILYTRSGVNDRTHHPDYARALHAHCLSVGVTSVIFGSNRNDLPPLPEGKSFLDEVYAVLAETWGLDGGDAAKPAPKADRAPIPNAGR